MARKKPDSGRLPGRSRDAETLLWFRSAAVLLEQHRAAAGKPPPSEMDVVWAWTWSLSDFLVALVEASAGFEVLGLRPGASRDEIEAMFKVKAKTAHPDTGGSDASMALLNRARESALKAAS